MIAMPPAEDVDDIEDLIGAKNKGNEGSHEAVVVPRTSRAKQILPKQKKVNTNDDVSCDSFVPGLAKVHVRTWGCAHNASDGEYMSGMLAREGYKLLEDRERDEADLWVLNSCAVKNPAEDHFRNEVEAARAKGIKVGHLFLLLLAHPLPHFCSCWSFSE